MQTRINSVVFLLILSISSLCHGEPRPADNYWPDGGPIEPSLWYLEDPNTSISFSQARGYFKEGKFEPEEASFNFGYTKSSFWVMFDLELSDNQLDQQLQDIIIEFNYPHLDYFEVYKVVNDGEPQKLAVMGDNEPFSSRLMHNNTFTIPDQIQAGNHYHYWVKLVSTSSMQLHPSIWKKNQYLEHKNDIQIAYGLFFGVLIVMALYNLLIGLFIRDKSYFYYVGHIISFGTLQACLWGYAFQYLWPNNPGFNDFAIPNSILLSLIFSTNFTRSFLQAAIHSPRLNKILFYYSIITIALIAINFFIPYQIRITLAIWSAFFGTILILSTGISVAREGHSFARLFLVAWCTFLIGAIIYGFTALGALPANGFTMHASQFGTCFEVIFLSLALADRINTIKAEKRELEKRSKETLKAKNEELENMLSLLQKSNALKDEFLATISHELRTPMNGIEGSLQIVRQSLEDKESNRHIDAAFHSAHHMTQLVDSLLEYSELQSGNWRLNERPFDLTTLIDKSTADIQGEYVLHDVKFKVIDKTDVRHLLIGDPDRIEHLIFQLLDNAFKFTRKGTVSIAFCSSEHEDSYDLTIEVIDSGIGISENKLADIFDSFRQVDGSFSRQYGGLGIGLSICKAIVDHLHGQITVDSQPNKGSTFTANISLVKGAEKKQPKQKVTQLPGNPHVLVVEDNPVNQLTLVAMVKKLGCQVSTANNGKEAVQEANKHLFDCILMDCQMPVMDGFEATKAIRESSNNQNTPIIAVTANAMSGDRDKCLQAGMNDYIKKPIKLTIIADSLQRWLSDKVA